MNFNAAAIDLLQCPYCTSQVRIKSTHAVSPDGGIESGILECAACNFEYPVVGGIPIFVAPHETLDTMAETDATILLPGPTGKQLTDLVRNGDATGALSLLLNPSKLKGDWFFPLDIPTSQLERREVPARTGGRAERWRNRAMRAASGVLLPRARLRLAEFLTTHGAELSAMDVLDFYYRRFSGAENFNYFAFRFGQPRHLAGLALVSRLDRAKGPILDLACGVGHMTHYLAESQPARVTIGSDRDFFRLWVANRYVAPRALFVCSSADSALPFRSAAFDGIFCSDAFHYFLQRAGSVREMRRVSTESGIIILARFGNAAVEPREGYELSVPQYAALFAGMQHVFIGEEELVRSYLAKRAPDLTRSRDAAELHREKWLSVVASNDPNTFDSGAAFEAWPHSVGRKQLNPIYRESVVESGQGVELRFQFPSDWYAFENQAYLAYAPHVCSIPHDVVEALKGHADPEVDLEQYLASFVVIGMPDLYLQSRAALDLLSRARGAVRPEA